MKVIDVINAVNAKEKIEDVAKKIGTSKSTLGKKIKSLGYVYSNSLKCYEFYGENSEKSQIDNMEISEVIKRKNIKKSEENTSNIRKKDETILGDNSIKKSTLEESVLTEDEIKSLKDLARIYKNNDVHLFIDLAFLPYDGEKVKKSISVDADLYLEFEKFADRFDKKGLSKNQLFELAMYDFMSKYHSK